MLLFTNSQEDYVANLFYIQQVHLVPPRGPWGCLRQELVLRVPMRVVIGD